MIKTQPWTQLKDKRERKVKCPNCGIELGEVAYFSCPRDPCPIQPKAYL